MNSSRSFRGFSFLYNGFNISLHRGLRYGSGIFFCICLVILTSNCMARGLVFTSKELTIEIANGTLIPMTAEIARTDQEREQGLMNRKKLDDGKGMIFIFEKDQILSFWMKNTLIPLSIAFISQEGKILEIHNMEPLNLNPVHSSRSARYALEVPQGWFNRVGISIGDIVHF